MQGCLLCSMVHKYIFVLWGVVIAGAAVLTYVVVAAGIRAVSEPAPTDPVSCLLHLHVASHFIKWYPHALQPAVWQPYAQSCQLNCATEEELPPASPKSLCTNTNSPNVHF